MSINLPRKFLLACILFGTIAAVRAEYQIESWTTDNGLPQNTVHSIVQTPEGYLWLATLDGLVRYDGVKFTVFNKNNSPGINSNRFTELVTDAHGDLWIGTENGEIVRYHDGSFQTFTLTDKAEDKPIWNLRLNDRGVIVVFTGTGIFRWDGEKFAAYTPIAGGTKNSVTLWSKTGAFWFADGQTIRRVKDGKTSDYRLPGASPITITNFLEDSRGRLWIGTRNNAGLFVLENERLTVYTVRDKLPEDGIAPRAEDRNGNLWAATDKGAVIISADGKVSRLTTEQGLSDNFLSGICEDREGNIWIGTFFGGLNRVSKQSVAFYSTKDGLQANIARPIYEDREGRVWIGGSDLTLYENGRFSAVGGREKGNSEITAIMQDSTGRLRFGSWGGVYYSENGKFTNFSDKLGRIAAVWDIHEDRDGNLWFATNAGLFRYKDSAMLRFTTDDGLVSNDVKVIQESPDGTFWLGTYGGISWLKDGVFTSFTSNDGLGSNLVRSLYEDADGTLWIGSYDGGLTRLKDGKFSRYTSNDGLFNDGVFQILEDERGNFWMSCNRGIYRVSKQQLNDFADGKLSRIESIAYGKADGLEETECNGGQQPAGIKTRDGRLWFPT